MQHFLEQLLPEESADVLVVAGDLSHYNAQSIFALRFFAAHFQHVFYVLGNHDYYLVSRNHATRYDKNSTQRTNELCELIKALPNVTWLHIFGHCHEQEVYVQQANYYINALGYPDEKLPQKMRVFTV